MCLCPKKYLGSHFLANIDLFNRRMAKNFDEVQLPLLLPPSIETSTSSQFIALRRRDVRRDARVGRFDRQSVLCDGLLVQVRNRHLQEYH